MTRAQLALMGAMALGLGVGVVLSAQPEFPPGQVAQRLSPEMVGVRADGGMMYYRQVRGTDGGYGIEEAATPGCRRRPVGMPPASCRRDAGPGFRDVGDMNRFPVSQQLGGSCDSVACGIEAGDDADLSDTQQHGKKRDAGRGPP